MSTEIVQGVFQRLGESVTFSAAQYLPAGTLPILFIVVVLALIVGIAIWIGTRPSLSSTQQSQQLQYRSLYESLAQSRKGVDDYLAQPAPSASKTNWVLLNFAPLTVFNAGFVGPLTGNGSYDPIAIRQALDLGFRAFVFQIDYYEGAAKEPTQFVSPGEPCLLARDELDVIRSVNCGRIREMMTALDTQAFASAAATGRDPLLVFLDFKHTPDPIASTSAYKQFLSSVSRQIQPLRKHLLTSLGETRFTNLENPNLLFTQNFQSFRGKTLVFTNVNTELFTQGGVPMEDNLRLMIHAQMFKTGVATALPGDTVTSAPLKGVLPPIFKQTSSYFLQTPSDQQSAAQAATNNVFTVLSLTDVRKNLAAAEKAALLTQYGVQVIPFHLYETPATTEAFLKEWGVWSWKMKPVALQYVVVMAEPPRTITPAANSNQGNITVPSLSVS